MREYFIGFVECDEGITGSALGTKILGTLQGYGLDLHKLRGQAYDGAANMSGATRALIREQYPLALYLHCASHVLTLCINLAVVKSLQQTSKFILVYSIARCCLVMTCLFFRHSQYDGYH